MNTIIKMKVTPWDGKDGMTVMVLDERGLELQTVDFLFTGTDVNLSSAVALAEVIQKVVLPSSKAGLPMSLEEQLARSRSYVESQPAPDRKPLKLKVKTSSDGEIELEIT